MYYPKKISDQESNLCNSVCSKIVKILQVFFVYWHLTGRMQTLIDVSFNSKAKSSACIRKKIFITLVLLFIFILCLLVEISVMKLLFSIDSAFMNPQADNVKLLKFEKLINFQIWYFRSLNFISLLIGIYNQYVFHLTFFIYITATATLYVEFEELNCNLKAVKLLKIMLATSFLHCRKL